MGVERAQVRLGDRQGEADRGLARVAVEVGGDEPGRRGERVVEG